MKSGGFGSGLVMGLRDRCLLSCGMRHGQCLIFRPQSQTVSDLIFCNLNTMISNVCVGGEPVNPVCFEVLESWTEDR